ncbi:MAG: ABC transporter ATP-binding protein [Candidatus Rokubacteria bacterium]|nr:ABC transporter ATP-binding protein [Candidatus Rokubacteria bacterium]
MAVAIEARGVVKAYGGVRALDGLDLVLGGGRIDAIIGPNGAGKTTLFNVLTGFVRPEQGHIAFDGRTIDRLTPDRRVRIGLVRSFQILELFPALTVGEVLTTAGLLREPLGAAKQQARALCAEFELPWGLTSADLTPGEVRRLELGRCMATRPRMLLLDEIMAGLTLPETDFMMERIIALHRRGIAVVVVEHVMDVIKRLCEHVHVLAAGKIIAAGTFDDVAADPVVVEAYLGTRSGSATRGAGSGPRSP